MATDGTDFRPSLNKAQLPGVEKGRVLHQWCGCPTPQACPPAGGDSLVTSKWPKPSDRAGKYFENLLWAEIFRMSHYFSKPFCWVQNQVIISCKFVSFLEAWCRVLIQFWIWPEKHTSVFNDLKMYVDVYIRYIFFICFTCQGRHPSVLINPIPSASHLVTSSN